MKRVFLILMVSLLLLAACEQKTTGKRVSIPDKIETGITGGAVADTGGKIEVITKESKTAAESLKDIKATGEIAPTTTASKTGNFYPPITNSSATGEDALKEKTHALFQKPVYMPKVDKVIVDSGAKYHNADGDPTNLPKNYGD